MTKPLRAQPAVRTAVRLEVVAERPERSRVVLRRDGRHPILAGDASTDLVCGECAIVLGRALELEQVQRLLLVCPACGSYNRAPER
jgi:hypothetical protein